MSLWTCQSIKPCPSSSAKHCHQRPLHEPFPILSLLQPQAPPFPADAVIGLPHTRDGDQKKKSPNHGCAAATYHWGGLTHRYTPPLAAKNSQPREKTSDMVEGLGGWWRVSCSARSHTEFVIDSSHAALIPTGYGLRGFCWRQLIHIRGASRRVC